MMTDPRERMVRVGNDLLDTLYRLAEHDDFNKRVRELADRKDEPGSDLAAKALMDDTGIETIVQVLTLTGQRDRLLREYVTIRQTIEALSVPRTDGLSL